VIQEKREEREGALMSKDSYSCSSIDDLESLNKGARYSHSGNLVCFYPDLLGRKKWFLADRVVAGGYYYSAFPLFALCSPADLCLRAAMQKEEGRSLAKSREARADRPNGGRMAVNWSCLRSLHRMICDVRGGGA
jgi:hypothetical protein